MLDHLPLPRHQLQRLGHVLAQLVQHPAAARAGRRHRIDDALARQMLGQRPARRLAPFECAHLNLLACCRGCRHLRHGLRFRRILFQVGQLQLELFEQCAPLRGLPKSLLPKLGDRELHLLDQQGARPRFGLRVLSLHLSFNARRVLGEKHCLQRLDVVGQRIRCKRHEAIATQIAELAISNRSLIHNVAVSRPLAGAKFAAADASQSLREDSRAAPA